MLTQRERAAFSLASLIRSTASNITRGSFELEVLHDLAQREGREFNATKMRIPWELFSRDMSAAGVSGSQYLVGTSSTPVADALRPWSVTVQAGITVLDGLTGNVTIPRVAADVTGQWLAGEHDPITASQPTIGQEGLIPKTYGALTTYSKLLEQQAPQAEQMLRAHLVRVAGQGFDAAVLAGSGVSGQPMGIANTPGVGTATIDSTDTWGDLCAMHKAVSDAGSEPTAIIATPAVRQILQGRSRFANTDTPVWGGSQIPSFATTTAPASKLIMGDFSQCVLGVWGSGFDLSIDPYTGWADGKITIRILASVDVALLHPASFSVAAVS